MLILAKFTKFHKQNIVKWAKARIDNFDIQEIDLEAEWDNELTIKENYNRIYDKIKEIYDFKGEKEGYEAEDLIEHYEREGRKHKEREMLKGMEEEPELDIDKTMEEIENFTYLGKQYTYSTLFSLMLKENVMNRGTHGCGKSRSSKELVEYLNVPKVVVVSGHLTGKGFFKLLRKFNECVVICDEGDLLLSSRQINQMIKTLFSNGKVEWRTDKGDEELDFKGSLIINCNNYNFKGHIKDKVILNQKSFSTREFKEKIKQSREYEPDKEIWEQIKKRIVYARNNPIKLTEEEEELIYDFIYDLNFIESFRVVKRTFSVFKGLKNLYGCLNEKILDLGRELARNYISNTIELKIISEFKEEIDRKELKEKLANAKNISLRQANRVINNLTREGHLKKINRTKLVRQRGE